jgi:phage baseplate assembly protein W
MAVARTKDWNDLDLDFFAHPTTKDVVRKKGVDAIKRSIRNLIMYNFYEKKFNHGVASGARGLLFENVVPLIETFLRDAIINVINNFEPRATLTQDVDGGVKIVWDQDRNGYIATISFIEVNSGLGATINVFLERIR